MYSDVSPGLIWSEPQIQFGSNGVLQFLCDVMQLDSSQLIKLEAGRSRGVESAMAEPGNQSIFKQVKLLDVEL